MVIKEFKLFNKQILKIYYDGIFDNYILLGRFKILKIENDRDFWNDWE